MNADLSLCLKITNWCNLKCAHCCELSGPSCAKQAMPLARMETLICQYNNIQFPRSEYFVLGGGEAMAPYFFGDHKYIPNALSLIYNIGGIPTIKTNAKWGKNSSLRQQILKDLAGVAYKYQILTTLDISVDEFHNNITEVANVISDIVKSQYIAPTIRISLVGFNTVASQIKLFELRTKLNSLGITTFTTGTEHNDFAVIYKDYAIQIFTSFNTPIYKRGRAIETGVYTAESNTGMPDSDGNCLTVDNTDNAILNYKFQEKIAGRPLNDVVQSLMLKLHRVQHQK